MEVAVIKRLINHWGKNGRKGILEESINEILNKRKIVLPKDFKVLYEHVDGTKDQDKEAFLFFKVEDLLTMKEKFGLEKNDLLAEIIIFADYMVDCWWYGIKVKDDNRYEIGIIPDPSRFVKITDSLSEFTELYLKDSPILYEYK
nr:SMI1/KNR4 family protein [Pedobacter panaciterrae]